MNETLKILQDAMRMIRLSGVAGIAMGLFFVSMHQLWLGIAQGGMNALIVLWTQIHLRKLACYWEEG
jgi:hypothetical protein